MKKEKKGEKKKSGAPDKGLEPLTLRLKVWCSTDWANRATLTKYLEFLNIIASLKLF